MDQEKWLPDEDLFPCANCEQKFSHPLLHIVDINIGVFDQRALNQRIGLSLMLGSSVLVKAMSAYLGIVKLNTTPEGKSRLLLCVDCFAGNINLAALREKVDKWHEERKTKNQEFVELTK